MEIGFDYINNILKTLPISYYCGRQIDVSLSPTADMPYYNTKADIIVISYKSIVNMMKYIKTTDDIENSIRADLYHEISHAMLTPSNLLEPYMLKYISSNKKLAHDVINVFEDERIETIFSKLFYGVDFKKSIIQANDWTGEPPKNVFEAFYHIVRYRTDYKEGRKDYLERVARIINGYRLLTSEKNVYLSENYIQEVAKLFWDIAKDWLEENNKKELDDKAEQQNGKGTSYDGLSEGNKEKAVKSLVEEQAGKGQAGNEGEGSPVQTQFDPRGDKDGKNGKEINVRIKAPHGKQTRNGGSGDEENEPGELKELTPEEMQALLDSIEKNIEDTDPLTEKEEQQMKAKTQKILQTSLNHYVDNSLTDRMSEIFENFLARTKNNGSAVMRYSGMLDPRLLATRDDWRIWKYKCTNGPIKGYDNFHLNLYIDTSGSYSNNEDKTNTILKSLDTLEKKYPFFSFDLVTCQRGETIRNKDQRYIESYGGNSLDADIWDIVKKLDDPKSFNYSIVLFDGDAFTDSYSSHSNEKNFGAWNSSKCSIISDSDNEAAINKYAPQAHRIIVKNRWTGGHKSYADMLYDNILEAMNKALL